MGTQGPTRWTTHAVEAELKDLAAALGRFPSTHDLRIHGRASLNPILHRTGGIDSWRERLGWKHGGTRRKWTDAAIEAELPPLVQKVGRWPTPGDFRQAGLEGLRKRLVRDDLVHVWAARLGVVPAEKFVWTDEAIEDALAPLVAEVDRWPTGVEFVGAGLAGLRHHLTVRETASAWAKRMGVEPRTGDSKHRTADHLAHFRKEGHSTYCLSLETESRIDAWVDALDNWPRYTAWQEAGHMAIYDRLGTPGRSFWRQRLLDGQERVRGPLAVSYEHGVAASWRFCAEHGHLEVPPSWRDLESGLNLGRWLELLASRTSSQATDAAALVAAVGAAGTDPFGSRSEAQPTHWDPVAALSIANPDAGEPKW